MPPAAAVTRTTSPGAIAATSSTASAVRPVPISATAVSNPTPSGRCAAPSAGGHRPLGVAAVAHAQVDDHAPAQPGRVGARPERVDHAGRRRGPGSPATRGSGPRRAVRTGADEVSMTWTPAAATAMRTWPGPGYRVVDPSRSGGSRRGPNSCSRIACMRVDPRTSTKVEVNHGRRRYASTARTRRWSSASGGRSSFASRPLMCLATAASVITSARAIAAFDRPSAISASTSRSRGVSRCSGSLRRPEQLAHDVRVDHRVPGRRPAPARRRTPPPRRCGP